MNQLHLEAGQRLDVLRCDDFIRGRLRLLLPRAIKDLAIRFVAIRVHHFRWLPLFRRRCCGGPRRISEDHALAAICELQRQHGEKTRRAAFVRRLSAQFVATLAQLPGHISLRRPLPVGIGQNGFAIEENRRAIVTSHAQHRLLHRRIAEIEILLQPRGAFRCR